jgi:DNA-binding CsgD family transcriptional regulator/catechol 2,3-dioxygenase-like lactoylglutathione lyase family enzyme
VLTPTEWRVVDAVRHGMSTRTIAARRGVSADAVKFHIANALAKLGLRNRAQLRAWRGVPYDSALNALAAPGKGTAGVEPVSSTDAESGLRLGPIGQISRHVSDIESSVAWYSRVLGLPHLYTFGDLAFFDCGGTRLYLSVAEPGADPGEPSVIYFRVPDIQQAFDSLTARGVEFAGAPHMIHRHESGVEEWMAFFNDPDGHLLAIMAQVQA